MEAISRPREPGPLGGFVSAFLRREEKSRKSREEKFRLDMPVTPGSNVSQVWAKPPARTSGGFTTSGLPDTSDVTTEIEMRRRKEVTIRDKVSHIEEDGPI